MKLDKYHLFCGSMSTIGLMLSLADFISGTHLDHNHYKSKSSPISSLRKMIQNRAVQSGEAVLLYSTKDSIYEFPFKSMASEIKEGDFRKVYTTTKYMISAFSASYKKGDNQLLYGKSEIYHRPLRSAPSYLSGEDTALSKEFNFQKHFIADWVDYNVYTINNRQLRMVNLQTHIKKVVNNISESARNLLVDQAKYFVAWIANDVNIVKINKDGSNEQTVWTEPHRKILCMDTDAEKMRFFFFVNDIEQLDEDEDARHAILFSVDYDAEDKPMREGSLEYRSSGSTIMHMAKYFERVFVVMLEKNDAGDQIYTLCQMKKKGEKLVDQIFVSQSWPITGLQVSWMYTDAPLHCNKANNRCSFLCAHLHNDKTPMCLCPDDNNNCKPYLMTPTPAPTRAAVTGKKKTPPSAWRISRGNDVWIWVVIALVIVLFLAGAYLVYLYFFSEDEGAEEGEEGMEGDGTGSQAEGSQTGSQMGQTASNMEQPEEPSSSAPKGWFANKWHRIKAGVGMANEETSQTGPIASLSNAKKKKNKGRKGKKPTQAEGSTSDTGTQSMTKAGLSYDEEKYQGLSTKKKKKKKKKTKKPEVSESLSAAEVSESTPKKAKKHKKKKHSKGKPEGSPVKFEYYTSSEAGQKINSSASDDQPKPKKASSNSSKKARPESKMEAPQPNTKPRQTELVQKIAKILERKSSKSGKTETPEDVTPTTETSETSKAKKRKQRSKKAAEKVASNASSDSQTSPATSQPRSRRGADKKAPRSKGLAPAAILDHKVQ